MGRRSKLRLDAKIAAARNGSTASSVKPTSRQHGTLTAFVAARLGLKPATRAEINRQLARMKTGDVLRLACGSEIRLGRTGGVEVTYGRSAPKPERTVSLPYKWSLDGNDIAGSPKRAAGDPDRSNPAW